MEDLPVDNQKQKFECVLQCKDSNCLYRFPRDDEARKTWLGRIGLSTLPRSIGLVRICSNHFSERMFSEGGKRLTRCAVPDINIPGMVISKPPDRNLQIIKPRPVRNYMNLEEIPRIVQESEIITHRSSRCFLKCKDAVVTFGFPHDQISLDIWAKQLGFKRMPPRTSTARICRNHFSARMFTSGKGRRLTSCAIPDINLPGQTIFRSEEEKLSNKVISRSDAMNQIIIPTENTVQLPDIITVVSRDKNDISAKLQSALESGTALHSPKSPERASNFSSTEACYFDSHQLVEETESDDKADKVCPEDINSNSECVLKCSPDGRLFEFPKMEVQRQLWLKQVGLKYGSSNTRICERHFSERMFVKSKKMLAKFAFPDINIPTANHLRKQKDSLKPFHEYRVILHDKHTCDVKELPQFISVDTILKGKKLVNGIKYVHHEVDKNIPKRERGVQVDVSDLAATVDVAIPVDSDSEDEFEFIENIEHQPPNWKNNFDSQASAPSDMYECLTCGEISIGRDSYMKHTILHKESIVLCSQCGKLFTSRYKLMLHERDKHLNNLRKVLRCPKFHCKKAFHSRKLLHHHVDEHTNVR